MNSKKLLCLAVLCIGLAMGSLTGCRSNKQVSSAFSSFNFQPAYVSSGADGNLVVRSWGTGSTKAEAVREAMKNAVNAVVFKGLSGCDSYQCQALVTEVNARQRYADYFDRFFATGGEYQKFVKEASKSDASRIESKSDSRQNYSVVVNVDRNSLRRQLTDDGIISPR